MVALTVLELAAAPPSARDLFASGAFERAKAAYVADLARDPNDIEAILGSARIALYENRLDDAARDGTKALALRPNDAVATRLLNTVADRRAVEAAAAGLDVPEGGVVIPFLEPEPLPAIELSVAGKRGTFLLDTGAPDITLDPNFAAECGLSIGGGSTGTFLGGKTAQVRTADVERASIGPIALTHLNATIIPVRGLKLYAHRTIDGVIGTVFLSRFLATVDYPNHRLVLQPRAALHNAAAAAIPMWLVGDHFIFAMGSVNGIGEQLFNIDSGGAGVGFLPTAATVAAAHLQTFADKAFQAMGGGGAARFIPTRADHVCIGEVCQREVSGGYTPDGSPLAIFPFTVAGSVSHEFLKHYAVTFDFRRMRMLLARPETASLRS